MINYDKTLKLFFDEILKYLDKRAKTAKDTSIRDSVLHSINVVRTVAGNPMRYADYDVRVKAGLETNVVEGFMAGTRDNSVYLLYNRVLWVMGDLKSEFEWVRSDAQNVLLGAVRQMKYKNATNLFKDFYFPFLSKEKFAVREKTK